MPSFLRSRQRWLTNVLFSFWLAIFFTLMHLMNSRLNPKNKTLRMKGRGRALSANLHLAFEDFADGGKLAAADGQGFGDVQYLRAPGGIAVIVVVQPYQVV